MLEDLFKPYNCTIILLSNNNAVKAYRFRCPPLNIDFGFSWLTRDKLEVALKPIVSKLIAVLANGAKLDPNTVYDKDNIVDFVNDLYVTLPPDSKLNVLLEYIGNQTSYDGDLVELKTPPRFLIAQMWFHGPNEWRFYMDNALKLGLIEKKIVRTVESPDKDVTKYNLTVSGLSRLIEVSAGKNSTTCFIAMAFTDEMFVVLDDAIKPALASCGFIHYVVSDQHVDSDTTINDAILAGIKKARFTIADFTYHRNGVYFEAGYALGRGQKVIYTCRKDEMANSHFDISHYQHIVWTDAADFKEKLINKIEAFIKD